MLNKTNFIWLYILLTVGGLNTSFAQSMCFSLFLNKTIVDGTKLAKIYLQESEQQEAANLLWKTKFLKIRSLNSFKKFINSIENNLSNMNQYDFTALQKINLVQLTNQLPSYEISKLKYIIHIKASKIRKNNQYNPIDAWVFPLDFYFYPENIISFFQEFKKLSSYQLNFADAYSGIYGLRSFNHTLNTVIQLLPTDIKNLAEQEIKNQMNQINLTQELMNMKEGQLYIPNTRLYRRNLETIGALLSRSSLDILKNNIVNQNRTRTEITEAVNQYYSQLEKTLTKERGQYSFSKVLDAGQIIHSHLSEFLTKNDEYILVYGSFTNGKASVKHSDIDIKLSNNLLFKLTQKSQNEINKSPFSLYFSDLIKREKNSLPKTFFLFWEKFQLAEIELGNKVFFRTPLQPSELLTILYPPKDFSNNSFDVRWYNPLVLKITKNQIILQLADLSGDLSITEIQIPNN